MRKLLYFHADWCPPCRFYANTVILPLEKKIGCHKIEKIDVQLNPQLAEKYCIERLPALVIVENENILLSRYGSLSANELEMYLKDNGR